MNRNIAKKSRILIKTIIPNIPIIGGSTYMLGFAAIGGSCASTDLGSAIQTATQITNVTAFDASLWTPQITAHNPSIPFGQLGEGGQKICDSYWTCVDGVTIDIVTFLATPIGAAVSRIDLNFPVSSLPPTGTPVVRHIFVDGVAKTLTVRILRTDTLAVLGTASTTFTTLGWQGGSPPLGGHLFIGNNEIDYSQVPSRMGLLWSTTTVGTLTDQNICASPTAGGVGIYDFRNLTPGTVPTNFSIPNLTSGGPALNITNGLIYNPLTEPTGSAAVAKMILSVSQLAQSVNSTQNVSIIVKDRWGATLTGITPTWTIADSSVAQITPNGLTCSVKQLTTGSTTLTVAVGNNTITVPVRVLLSAASRPYGRVFIDSKSKTVDKFPMATAGLTTIYDVPSQVVDTTIPVLSGSNATVFPVTASNGFDSAVQQAYTNNGGVVAIDPGLFITEGNIPAAPQNFTGILTIQTNITKLSSSVQAALPASYSRIDNTLAENNFGGFITTDYNNSNALTVQSGARNVWFRFLTCKQSEGNVGMQGGVVYVSQDTQNIVIKQTLIRPNSDDTVECRRGVYWLADSGAIVDSYIGQFRCASTDAQAILQHSTKNAFKVVNNYLCGGAENFMSGGTTPYNGYSVDTYYPRNLEFRRNHLHTPMRWNPFNRRYRDVGQALRSNLTVASSSVANVGVRNGNSALAGGYGQGDFSITLASGSTFDTTQLSSYGSFGRINYRMCVVGISGPGAGGWSEIVGYPSNQVINVSNTYVGYWPGGVVPTSGSVVEVRKIPRIRTKNLFELKCMFGASWISENVCENQWHGEDTQLSAFIIKNTGNGAGNNAGNSDTPFAYTINTNVVDNAIVGVMNGIQIAGYGQDSQRGDTGITEKTFIDNTLIVGTQTPYEFRSALYMSAPDAYTQRVSGFGYQDNGSAMTFDNPNLRDIRINRFITDAGGDYPVRPILGTPDYPGAPAYAAQLYRNVPLGNRLWEDMGLASMGDTRWPQQGNDPDDVTRKHRTFTTATPLAMPITSGDWTAASWACPEPSFKNIVFNDGTGTGDLGIDWTDLQTRLAGVRSSNIAFEWERS